MTVVGFEPLPTEALMDMDAYERAAPATRRNNPYGRRRTHEDPYAHTITGDGDVYVVPPPPGDEASTVWTRTPDGMPVEVAALRVGPDGCTTKQALELGRSVLFGSDGAISVPIAAEVPGLRSLFPITPVTD